ncbi:MAG: Rap1a/Tai family immunity protein [Gammaproteobacteria bacterium]
MKLRDSRLMNARRLAVITGLAALGMVSNAFPQWMDGDDLLRVCSTGEVVHIFKPGVCPGYLMASIDLAEGLHANGTLKAPLFCMPAEITMQQAQDMVVKYVEGHPARKEANASLLVLEAFQDKYPCK